MAPAADAPRGAGEKKSRKPRPSKRAREAEAAGGPKAAAPAPAKAASLPAAQPAAKAKAKKKPKKAKQPVEAAPQPPAPPAIAPYAPGSVAAMLRGGAAAPAAAPAAAEGEPSPKKAKKGKKGKKAKEPAPAPPAQDEDVGMGEEQQQQQQQQQPQEEEEEAADPFGASLGAFETPDVMLLPQTFKVAKKLTAKQQEKRDKRKLRHEREAAEAAAAAAAAAAAEVPKKARKAKAAQAEEKSEEGTEEKQEEGSDDDDEEEEEHVSPPGEERNSRTIFVGNLPLSFKRKDAKRLFAPCGAVESARLRSAAVLGTAVDESGNQKLVKRVAMNKGAFSKARDSINAYVVFASPDSVAAALQLNGQVVEDHVLRVDRLQVTHDTKRSVFLGNLPFNATEDAVRAHFAAGVEGEIENVRLIRDADSGLGKGFGYVLFTDHSSVGQALGLNGQKFMKRELRVQVCGKRYKNNKTDGRAPFEGRRSTGGAGRRVEGKRKRSAEDTLKGIKPKKVKKPKTAAGARGEPAKAKLTRGSKASAGKPGKPKGKKKDTKRGPRPAHKSRAAK